MVKGARFELRAEPERLDRWRAAADADGRSLGDWLARVADAAAQQALSILPSIAPGLILSIRRTDEKIEQIRTALRGAIDELGASPTADAMGSILEQLDDPEHRGGYTFSASDVDLIRRAQTMAVKRPSSRAPRR